MEQEMNYGEMMIGGREYFIDPRTQGGWVIYPAMPDEIPENEPEHFRAESNPEGTEWKIMLGDREIATMHTEYPRKVGAACQKLDETWSMLRRDGLI